jgi:hypothetical protein
LGLAQAIRLRLATKVATNPFFQKGYKMPEVAVQLSERNMSRIRNGHTVLLKPTQLGSGSHKLQINDELAKRVGAAMKKNKGVKIQLSAQEIEASGLRSALKRVGRAYQRSIKPVVGPVIRDVMTQVVKKGLPAAAIAMGQPELAAPAAFLADRYAAKAVNALGDATGGFGLKKKKQKQSSSLITYDGNMSGFLPANHPALWPTNVVQADHSIRGGSFKLA